MHNKIHANMKFSYMISKINNILNAYFSDKNCSFNKFYTKKMGLTRYLF